MAQFTTTDGKALLKSMWPSALPQYSKESANIADFEQTKQLVPANVEELAKWCYVGRDENELDMTRRNYLAYHTNDPASATEVTLSFQGVIEKLSIGTYGTWTGRQSDAPVAVQAITLGGKFGRAVHLAQAKAAHKLCRFVVEELRGNVSFKPAREISFLRRVFVRVRPGVEPSKRVDRNDTRHVAATKMRRNWALGEGISLGIQENGIVRPADHRVFHRGDFVSIVATIEISCKREFNRINVRTTFKPVQMVRLATAAMAKQISGRNVRGDEDGEQKADDDEELEGGLLGVDST